MLLCQLRVNILCEFSRLLLEYWNIHFSPFCSIFGPSPNDLNINGMSINVFPLPGHHNPHLDSWPANSSLVTNSRVKIGGFLLGSELKQKFTDFKPFTSDFKPANADFKIYAGLYYHSNNLWSPEVRTSAVND